MRGTIFSFIFLVLLVTACKKEYSYEGGNGIPRKCVGCEYLPLCDSSVFVYVDSSNTIDTLTGIVRVGSDSTIDGKTYSHVTGFAAFPDGLLYNCDGGDYKTILDISSFGINTDSIVQALLQTLPLPFPIPPGTIQVPEKFKTSFLKTTLPVNGSWNDVLYSFGLPPLFSFSASLDYKIIEKGVQRTEFQKTYSNVIHVSGKLKITSTLGNIAAPNFVVDYFFAKDVGIIEIKIFEDNVLTRHTKLWSYQI
jgi:hypothetical protein